MEGIFLNCSPQRRLLSAQRRMKIAYLRQPTSSPVSLELAEGALHSVEQAVWLRASETAGNLRKYGVDMVLYANSMSPILKQQLDMLDIEVIENIGEEEAGAVADRLGLAPWTGIDQAIEGCINHVLVQPIELGDQIGVKFLSESIQTFTLIMAAPNQCLAQKFSQELFSVLKVCRLLWKTVCTSKSLSCKSDNKVNLANQFFQVSCTPGAFEEKLGRSLIELGVKENIFTLCILGKGLCSLERNLSDKESCEPKGVVMELLSSVVDCLIEFVKIEGVRASNSHKNNPRIVVK